MSFQDVGRRRKHFIFDNQNTTNQTSQSDIKEERPRLVLPKEKRGVRPRLSTRCPVTSRKLLDDTSLASATVVSNSSRPVTPTEEEDPMIPPVTPSPLCSKSQSIYAHLTTEIVNFQKMVSELDNLMEVSGQSPEAQWRTRILLRSAQDADRDIWKRLYEYEQSYGENPNYSRAQVASRKLHRDFRRVHKQLSSVLTIYEQRQQVEISFLSREEEKKEEFFDRAMRERDEEVHNIHDSMRKVNDIYTDLAAMVDGQQEQIDKVAEETEYSKTNTRDGMEHIQNSLLGLCGPTKEDRLNGKSKGDPGVRVDEDFQWSMPFETIGNDMRAVQQDVYKFGRNLIEDLQENVQKNHFGTGLHPRGYCTPVTFTCHDAGPSSTSRMSIVD